MRRWWVTLGRRVLAGATGALVVLTVLAPATGSTTSADRVSVSTALGEYQQLAVPAGASLTVWVDRQTAAVPASWRPPEVDAEHPPHTDPVVAPSPRGVSGVRVRAPPGQA